MRAATGLAAAVALTVVSILAPVASGDVIPLNLLAAGDTFTSDNGKLVFSDLKEMLIRDVVSKLLLVLFNHLLPIFHFLGSVDHLYS